MAIPSTFLGTPEEAFIYNWPYIILQEEKSNVLEILKKQREFFQPYKGLEDLDVPQKMERLKRWCEDINAAQEKVRFDYVFVDEEDFERYKPDSFSELVKNFRRYKDGLKEVVLLGCFFKELVLGEY